MGVSVAGGLPGYLRLYHRRLYGFRGDTVLGWSPQRPTGKARERNEEQIRTWRRKTWPGIKKKPASKGARSSLSTKAD